MSVTILSELIIKLSILCLFYMLYVRLLGTMSFCSEQYPWSPGVTTVLTLIALLSRATQWSCFSVFSSVNDYDIIPCDRDKIFFTNLSCGKSTSL